MSASNDAFADAMFEYLTVISALPRAGDDTSVRAAVDAAPNDHPVHAMAVRSYRCNGCRRLGLLRDVVLNITTAETECPVCECENLELIEEGRA